jgi:hypothetical protein
MCDMMQMYIIIYIFVCHILVVVADMWGNAN